MHVAYVLLPEAATPDPDLIAAAYAGLFPARGPLVHAGDAEQGEAASPSGGPPGSDDAGAFALACADGVVNVLSSSEPVPDGAAERAETRSLAAIGQEERLPTHHAHVLVAWFPAEGMPPGEALRAQLRVTAAVALATDAIGVYVPAASATHPAEWYVEVARQVEDPMMLWIGVSHAITDDDRHSFLSFGMHQLALPDLLLSAPLSEGSEAIEFFYELIGASCVAGTSIVPGEIVGRTPGELLTARQEPNPVDDEMVVIAIDLPASA